MVMIHDEEGNHRPEALGMTWIYSHSPHWLEVNPLLRAVILDLPSVVKHILAAGVDADTRYEYGSGDITALEAATLLQHVGVARALIEHGVEVNGIGVGGRTVLQNAVLNDQVDPDLVDLLLSAGADIDARTDEGFTALHMATEWPGDNAAVLLQRGPAKNAQDNEGRSPLHLAAECGNPAATRALLAAGADATLRIDRGCSQISPLDVAARYGHVEVIRELARHGVDMNDGPSTLFCGGGCLHHAAAWNHPAAIDALIEAGASIDAQSCFLSGGVTPLHSAVPRRALEAMHALLRHGASVRALPVKPLREGGTGRRNTAPLHAAARAGGMEGAAKVVDLLLRWGADESELDSHGKTVAENIGFFSNNELLNSSRFLSYPFTSRMDAADADKDRMRELLANAPLDRVWRRRGLLLLCLARNRGTTRRRSRKNCAGERKMKENGKEEEEAEEGALAKDGGGEGGSGGGGAFPKRYGVGVSVAATAGRYYRRERAPPKLGGRRARFAGVRGGGSGGCNGGGSGGQGLENGDGFDGVAASLLAFEEEGFFRTIVGYL